MNTDFAIKVVNLSKQYYLGKKKEESFRSSIGSFLRVKKEPTINFLAIDNVNFEIKKGDIVGIIGKNGAGKSTLLKILSQITKPTNGQIEINGRISSLLEVGTGFHPDLTGRENIFLNGTILGMTRKEVKEKFDEIVDFSGVEKFIDTPVKNYSSGMYVRLAFAVAAHLEPEILIIDEVLAVGDAEFQKKCIGKMGEVAKEGRTVIFVSHNMPSVKALCNKGIVMTKGEIAFNGEILEAIDYYHLENMKTSASRFQKDSISSSNNEVIELIDFEVVPRKGNLLTMFSGIDFVLTFKSFIERKNTDITFEVVNHEDLVIFHKGGNISTENNLEKGVYKILCSLPEQLLNTGLYTVNLIFGENQRFILQSYDDILTFEVLQEIVGSNSNKLPGLVFPDLKIIVEKVSE